MQNMMLKTLINQVAKRMGVKDTNKLNNAIEQAFNLANSNDPFKGVSQDFLRDFRQKMDNPQYDNLFKTFNLDKKNCQSFLDNQINNKTKPTNTNNTNKYKKGMQQFK